MATYRYVFTGIVHPERATVTTSVIPVTINAPDAGIVGMLNTSIVKNQITCVFDTDVIVANLYTLRNYASDAVRLTVDTIGFLCGHGYDIEIVQILPPESASAIVFGVEIPAVQSNPAEVPPRFQQVMQLFADHRSSHLQRCLADLREAIRSSPRDTGFFCFRAIECIRQFFLFERGAKSDKESWEQLRTELDVDRPEIDYIKGFADPSRHGSSKYVSDQERAEVFRKTWTIVNKYIEFANKGYPIA